MAYFEQRKSGWMAQIRRKGAPTISRTFDLKADAEAWAREIEREHQRGNIAALSQEAQRTTFAEVADDWIKHVLPSKKDHGASTYARAAKEKFGSYFLAKIRNVDVATWRDDLLAAGYSPQTVIHHLRLASVIFSHAERELSIHLPAGNPVKAVSKPPAPKARDRRLRAGELEYLLRGAEDARKQVVGLPEIIIMAVESSMRLGELLNLEWARVDLKRRIAHLVDTKNGESRTVALSSAAVKALSALRHRNRDKKPPGTDQPADRESGRVFAGWGNKDSFEKTWQRCVKRAQALYGEDCAKANKRIDPTFLANLRFHDLRHEATSRLFEKGLGIMEVASMTGHKSLSMLKRYTHVEAEKLARKLG